MRPRNICLGPNRPAAMTMAELASLATHLRGPTAIITSLDRYIPFLLTHMTDAQEVDVTSGWLRIRVQQQNRCKYRMLASNPIQSHLISSIVFAFCTGPGGGQAAPLARIQSGHVFFSISSSFSNDGASPWRIVCPWRPLRWAAWQVWRSTAAQLWGSLWPAPSGSTTVQAKYGRPVWTAAEFWEWTR